MPAPAQPPAFTAAAPASADDDGKENAAAALREQVVRHVLSSDVLNSVKAHLRSRLYAELKGSNGSGSATGWCPSPPRSPSLHEHILNCLVSDFLLTHQYKYTLSVFLSETGSSALPRLARPDLLRLLGVLPESKVHSLLTCAPTDSTGSDVGAGQNDAGGSGMGAASGTASLAERMVGALSVLGGRVSTHIAACQTDECWDDFAALPLPNASSSQLAERLAAIEEEYRRKSGACEAAAAASLEERMAAYQRECDSRCAAQLEQRLAAFREAELAAVREEQARKHAAGLAAERAVLAAAHQERLAALSKQEEELLDRVRRMQRDQDQQREEHLRRMRADEDRQQAWRAEAEAKLATREAAAQRSQEQATAAARAATAAREEGEQQLAAKLAEAAAQRAEAVRARAAADAELERVATLQRQLAAALEEQGALRQQLSSAQAAHLAEAGALRHEAAALRQDNERLAAAVAAAANGASNPPQGLSPTDSARLQGAVRRLMQRVEQLQGEVEAGRERERVWRGASGEAEKLLSKSIKAQDHSLQHAEDLRLALSAAAREVGDLQQQAALAAAGVEGPVAAALQATCRDTQRWREAAEARVGAAKQAEEQLRREAAQLQQRAAASRAAAAAGLQQVLGALVQGRRRLATDTDGDSSSGERSPPAHAPAPPGVAGLVSKYTAASQPAGAMLQQQAAMPAMQQQQQQPAATLQRGAEQSGWSTGPPALPQVTLQQTNSPSAQAGSFGVVTNGIFQQSAAPAQQPQAQQAQQGQQAVVNGTNADGTKPPASRTASDILAAYRARQQQRSASGGSASSLGLVPAGLSRQQSLSRDTSAAEEAEGLQQATGQMAAGVGSAGPSGNAAAAGPEVPDGDGYYVSDFTSEDSSRF